LQLAVILFSIKKKNLEPILKKIRT